LNKLGNAELFFVIGVSSSTGEWLVTPKVVRQTLKSELPDNVAGCIGLRQRQHGGLDENVAFGSSYSGVPMRGLTAAIKSHGKFADRFKDLAPWSGFPRLPRVSRIGSDSGGTL